ncbi:PaaI family thioesterase [Syntrophomonas curvata]
MVNDNDLRRIVNEIENMPFLKYLSLKVSRWEPGKCELFIPATGKFINRLGEINLGVCSILCEAGSYIAACTDSLEGKHPVIYSSKVSLLHPKVSGAIYISSGFMEGETDRLIESKVVDEQGKLIALATNRYLLVVDIRVN